jgi:lysophospholipase L1-like esterase
MLHSKADVQEGAQCGNAARQRKIVPARARTAMKTLRRLSQVKMRTVLRIAAAFLLITAAFALEAQTAAPAAPAQPQNAQSQGVDGYRNAHEKQLLTDFGFLARYRDANAQLPPAQPDDKRVVFMGDSITESWHLDQSFSGKPYINRGISGQTTPQMLVRFRQDVLELKPKVVIILAGTNDVAGNTGPMTAEQTEGNIQSMAQLAAANGIRVVLCSILPANHYGWAPTVQGAADKILAINTWIKSYAASQGYSYVDYHSAMKNAQNGLSPELSKDGVHPLPAGYAIMAPLADAGIAKALAK